MKNMKMIYTTVFTGIFWLASLGMLSAQDLVVLGGTYDQATYPGYTVEGTYFVQISKTDSYTFTDGQFEINISLPLQGSYDPARASQVVLPAGWELVVNSSQSLILRLISGAVFAGSGPGINRRRDFTIPIITTASAQDAPTLATVQWNDPEVNENPAGNSGGSVLNVLDVPLPVTLISFDAAKENQTGLLKWSTTMEINSDRFEVQRSLNGKNWNKIGVVASYGESAALKNYSFTDAMPLNGDNLYRLRIVDKDETFAYSRVVNVNFEFDLSVYPNPTSEKLNIRDFNKVKELVINDVNGRTLYKSISVSSGNGEISIRNLTDGMYIVRITRLDGSLSTQKVVVTK